MNSLGGLENGSDRKWWTNIKQLIGLKSKDSSLQGLANAECNGDLAALTELINKGFVEVSQDLTKLSSTGTKTFAPESVPDNYVISPGMVEHNISKINVHKAIGPDKLINWILKDMVQYLKNPICAIFNQSVREGCIPKMWRSADICPIPKVTPPGDIRKDLRPISLTPILAKTLESFIVNWTRKACPDIDKTQYGAESGSSTTHALLEILQPIYYE